MLTCLFFMNFYRGYFKKVGNKSSQAFFLSLLNNYIKKTEKNKGG